MTFHGSSVRCGKGRRRCSERTTVGGLALAAALSLMAAPTAARAQTASIGVSIAVNPVLFLSAAGSFTFNTPTDGDYTAGFVSSSAGPTLTHRGNVPYKITIQAQTGSTMSFAPYTGRSDADPLKPVGALSLRPTTGGPPGTPVALGAAGFPADFYTRASKGGTLNTTVDAQLVLSYANDPPGTYSTTVVFTIVAQ